MAGIGPGSGGDATGGWVRTDEEGDYIPCGCGQAVQRPDANATATVTAIEARRVFVCEREACDRRTVQRVATSTEGDR